MQIFPHEFVSVRGYIFQRNFDVKHADILPPTYHFPVININFYEQRYITRNHNIFILNILRYDCSNVNIRVNHTRGGMIIYISKSSMNAHKFIVIIIIHGI